MTSKWNGAFVCAASHTGRAPESPALKHLIWSAAQLANANRVPALDVSSITAPAAAKSFSAL